MLSTFEVAKSLIQAAESEAYRLKEVLAQFKAANEASQRFLETARNTEHRPNIKTGAPPSLEICRERGDMASALAEEVHDPGIKRFLLNIAKSYDEFAQ